MLKKVFLLAVIVLLGGCKSEPEIPQDIMSEAEMVKILIEMRLAEGKVNSLALPTDSAKSLYLYVESQLLKELDIDTSQYIKSFQYYVLSPESFTRISETVIDSLKARQKRVTTLR